MAKATFTKGYTPPPPPQEPSVFNLQLSPEELAALIVVLRGVGGGGPRSHINSILSSFKHYEIVEKIHRMYGGPSYNEQELFDKSGSITLNRYTTAFKELVRVLSEEGGLA